MFRSINLCGAEINTKFSEQHRTHLLHSSIKIYCNQFALCCQHKRIPVRTLEQPIWHERIESTSFAGRFVRLDPRLFLTSWSYVGTYH